MTDDLVGQIRRSLWAIRDHYEGALDGPRRGASIGGGAGTREPPAPGSLEAMQARAACHADLLHYTRVIQFEVVSIDGELIQTKVDGDDINRLAAFIDTWAGQLVEQTSEGHQCVADLDHHAHQLKALALPDRKDWVSVGHCPLTVAKDGESVECGTRLRAYPGRNFITCRGCGHEDTLGWWRSRILGHRPTLVTATDLVDILFIDARIAIEVETVRQWAHRGKVTRCYGPRRKGEPWLYDWARVIAELSTPRARAS